MKEEALKNRIQQDAIKHRQKTQEKFGPSSTTTMPTHLAPAQNNPKLILKDTSKKDGKP